ncbi:MAG: hypothetical protein JWM64_2959 [Frankiales bacterium]|nr:hypothetical protein [Frankiales bacterium]
MLNKVPEVTIWFWIIKILCTTVGESFADYINTSLGFGLHGTAVLFTVVLAVALGLQFRTDRYVPAVYWFAVVVISVAGTLYTDILTDDLSVPLALTSTVFTAVLVAVFGTWYARERTLSIHSIVTLPREAFYWLTVLVTFALGTATGDWTLELTGWTPGVAVLLPLALIAIVTAGWRSGANPVLAFWLAYILTRPLGANLGDFLGLGKADGGLGLGTLGTSLLFLTAIAATVLYLTVSRVDVGGPDREDVEVVQRTERERAVLAGYVVAAVVTVAVVVFASHHKGSATLAESEQPAAAATLPPGRTAVPFTSAQLQPFAVIDRDVAARVQSGQQGAAVTRVKDLESAWDDAQASLQAQDPAAWTSLDGQVDDVLTSVRAAHPDQAEEAAALAALLRGLGQG